MAQLPERGRPSELVCSKSSPIDAINAAQKEREWWLCCNDWWLEGMGLQALVSPMICFSVANLLSCMRGQSYNISEIRLELASAFTDKTSDSVLMLENCQYEVRQGNEKVDSPKG